MTKISPEQVAAIAAVGTPPGTTVAQWVAKARQESGFRTDVEDFLGSGHWGLWQIDEDHFGKPGMPAASSKEAFIIGLKIPGFNWMAAKALYAQSGWAPWRASGGKPTPSPADERAAGTPDNTVLEGGDGGILGTAGDFVDSINPVDELTAIVPAILAGAKWIGNPANWTRVVQVGAGIGIVLIAASIVIRPVVNDAVKNVGKAVPL